MLSSPSAVTHRAEPSLERLKVELTLTIGGTAFSIPGGQVKALSAQLSSHGFSAAVSFWSTLEKDDAPLYKAFIKQDLILVRLAISGVLHQPKPPPPPLVLQGVVRTRDLVGRPQGTVGGTPRNFRRYSVTFADAAQVLWRQHRPTELHTQKTLKDLLEAHRVDPIQLSYDWDALTAEMPLVCLALGEDVPTCSFYDFVLWYVQAHGGSFTYDYTQASYVLSGEKPTLGPPARLDRRQVRGVEATFPSPPRHGTRVLNTFASAPTTKPLEQKLAATGIWQDVLLRTPLAAEAEQREPIEKQRLRPPKSPRLSVSFAGFPTLSIHPGAAVLLKSKLWPPSMTGSGKPLRVREVALEAQADQPEPQQDDQVPETGYHLGLSAVLEPAADPVPHLPPFRAPRYPIYVEGKVYSPGGEQNDRLYFLVEDEKNSLLHWRVQVPLWNKTVSVPARPGHFPGHFYFPPYKNARVLVALYFDRAELHRFLDWGEAVRMPQDAQGDQELLGKNATSQTALSHDFQDNKPVWQALRTSDKDTQKLRMSEGNLFIQVKEEAGGSNSAPTFDVSPQVEAAKGEMASAVGGAVTSTSAAFGSAMGDVKAGIQGASEEANSALEGASAAVSARVAEARAELNGALGKLDESGAQVTAAASEAKATLQGLL